MNGINKTNKNTRESGIEILRIFAACSVVFLHYNDMYAFDALVFSSIFSHINKIILYLGESVCIFSVDFFILISGYFLSRSEVRSLDKPLKLLLQVVIFKVCIYLLSCYFFNDEKFSSTIFLLNLIPANYFVVLYSVLYFISPYINRIFVSFSKSEWKRLIILLMCIFSIYQTFIDLFHEIIGKEIMGLSPVSAWGGSQGFNIVNFMLMYILGAFFYYNNDNIFFAKKKFTVFVLIFSILIVFLWSLVNDKFARFGLRSSWCYHNPFVIFIAIAFFSLFKNIKLKNRIINRVSQSAFTCFLFHPYLLPFFKISIFVHKNPLILILHSFFTCVMSFFISYFVYEVYNFFISYIFKKIKFKKIQYFN